MESTSTCDDKSYQCHYDKDRNDYPGLSQHYKPRLILEAYLESVPDDYACKYGRYQSDHQVSADERLADERPFGTHQFHGVEYETLGVDCQFDSVVYQRLMSLFSFLTF